MTGPSSRTNDRSIDIDQRFGRPPRSVHPARAPRHPRLSRSPPRRSMRVFSPPRLRLASSPVSRRVVVHAPLKPSRLGSTTVRAVHSRSAPCAIAGAPVIAVVVAVVVDAHRATPALSKREINFPRLIATLSSRASRTGAPVRARVPRGRSLRASVTAKGFSSDELKFVVLGRVPRV